MKIDISNSELCDKYSILEIKLLNNLDVVKESSLLSKQFQELIDEHPTLKYYYEILFSINKQLWLIEDEKRTCEKNKNFNSKFILLSRSVYMLNDQRAAIKKIIDVITESFLTEEKSYEHLRKK